jgi:hypothetical protein
MLNSTVLEVAIGLVFCYASVALIASSVYEAIASMFKMRASSLLDGIKAMLNDPKFVGLAKALYNHALINPTDSGAATTEDQLTVKPSYIDPKHFAVALIESIQQAPGAGATLGAKIDAIPDAQLRMLLGNMYERAGRKIENLQAALENWFDNAMERVSGSYKRKAQLFSFLIALALTGLLNIDSFHLFGALWRHPAYVAQVSVPNAPSAATAFANLEQLPVGWGMLHRGMGPQFWIVTCLGWLVTASSALFGSPFWFDLLQRLVNLRGTGPKPAKSDTGTKPAPMPVQRSATGPG